jgi:hypothetical protein
LFAETATREPRAATRKVFILGGLGGCSAGKKLKVVSKEKEVLKTLS